VGLEVRLQQLLLMVEMVKGVWQRGSGQDLVSRALLLQGLRQRELWDPASLHMQLGVGQGPSHL